MVTGLLVTVIPPIDPPTDPAMLMPAGGGVVGGAGGSGGGSDPVIRGQTILFAALQAMKGNLVERQVLMYSDATSLSSVRSRRVSPAFALAAAITLSGLPPIGNAQVSSRLTVASLEGSWSGGGTVSFAGGKEQARCKARFSRAGAHSYTVNATCATASGRAAQTATVRQSEPTDTRADFTIASIRSQALSTLLCTGRARSYG